MIRDNIGNIRKVANATNCYDLKLIKDALKSSNTWEEAYKYVREHN
jgi:hypothetical protein